MAKRDMSDLENDVPKPAAKMPRVAKSDDGSGGVILSDYERARMQRINENQALLGELNLGLTPHSNANRPARKQRARPAPEDSDEGDNDGGDAEDEEYRPPPSKLRRPPPVKTAVRRSLRIAAAVSPQKTASPSVDGWAVRRSSRLVSTSGVGVADTATAVDEADDDGEWRRQLARGRVDLADDLADLLDRVKPFGDVRDGDGEGSSASPERMRFRWLARPLRKRVYSLALRHGDCGGGGDRGLLLGAAGDTFGNVGLFTGDGDGGGETAAVASTERLHARAVTELAFGSGAASNLMFSSGYDGLVRVLDLAARAGDEVSAELHDAGLGATALACLPAGWEALAIGGEDGSLRLLDRRAGKLSQMIASCGRRLLKCVDPHPDGRGLCLTAGQDGRIHLWDLRSPARPLRVYDQGRCVDSAYWSPTGDRRFLATSLNDTVRVYDAAREESLPVLSIRHNNNTTRYLSNFRAVWCPNTGGGGGDCGPIAVGSMENSPRRIELYCPETGRLIGCLSDENLTTVTSLVRWDPGRRVLCGANSTGKVFAFGQVE